MIDRLRNNKYRPQSAPVKKNSRSSSSSKLSHSQQQQNQKQRGVSAALARASSVHRSQNASRHIPLAAPRHINTKKYMEHRNKAADASSANNRPRSRNNNNNNNWQDSDSDSDSDTSGGEQRGSSMLPGSGNLDDDTEPAVDLSSELSGASPRELRQKLQDLRE
jgi:hypothetical protein